ncbi:regulator of hemoglobinization and erythroid cell expansion protein [Pluvialis apricaria]
MMSTCEWWVLVTTSAVTLILYALLLLTLYIALSRKIASHSCGTQVSGSPAAQPQQPPTSAAAGEGVRGPTSAGSSETSSETSEDSDSSPSTPQSPSSAEKLNYTSLVFPGKGHGKGSARDYENVKTRADYVNVDPKKRKADFWPCSSPVASKSIEYTEVKL